MMLTRRCGAALALLCLAAAARADMKVKSRIQMGERSSESVVYIKGKRQRTEMSQGVALIMQCDLKRTVYLYDQMKAYMVMPFDGGTGTEGAEAVAPPAGEPARRGGVVTTTITLTDTGERQQMFGYTARRLRASTVSESSPDACSRTKSRIESDGWYIDLPVALDCYDGTAAWTPAAGPRQGCYDEHRTRRIGAARLGYPVKVTTTTYDEQGRTTTYTQEVVEISRAALADDLFDIPAGYREVRSQSELFSAQAATKAAGNDDDNATSSSSVTGMSGMKLPNAPASVGAPGASASSSNAAPDPGPKRAGVTRVGVALPRATAGEGVDAASLAETVRHTMLKYLKGPAIETIMLDARLPAQIDLEARRKECDYVVHSTVTHKKGSGGFGSLLKKAAPVVDVMPVGSTAGAVASAAARAVVYTAAELSGSLKARDELTLEYELRAPGGSSSGPRTLKAKARSDGEDIISPLVEQAARAVLAEAVKR